MNRNRFPDDHIPESYVKEYMLHDDASMIPTEEDVQNLAKAYAAEVDAAAQDDSNVQS